MKKIALLLFPAAIIFAQTDMRYQENLIIGYSDSADYVIVKGDNLWNLAKKYYGSGFEWRYIWERNEYIKDPHWIYPGKLLFIPGISSIKNVEKSSEISLYGSSKTFTQLRDQTRKYPSEKQFYLVEKYMYYFSLEALRQAPFVYDKKHDKDGGDIDIFDYGEVANNKRPILAQNQNVLIRMETEISNNADYFKIGAHVDFYSIRNDLMCKNGIVSEPVATGVIKYVDNDYTTVYIEKLWGVLRDGAKIAPTRKYKPIGEYLTYKNLDDSLEVQVIARMNPDISLKPSEFLFIDKGTHSGINIGDHITFYQQARKGAKKKYADEPAAEGLVVAVEKNTATVRTTNVWELSLSNSLIGMRNGKIVAK
ncbi:MAG: LysM peptidoglycan-binding domain-containing protein [Chitinispirillales bacterium]|nr:LysM peptidoglycan-binding domain-containing protein [Chitinispirillales bacterium]